MFYARRDYLVITCVDDEPPVEHKLRRGVTVLAKICEVERRGSCRYRKIVEKLELYVQPIFDQNTRDYLWSCLRHLRVSTTAGLC